MLSKADQRRIAVQLQQFDCTQREAEIYLASLHMGPVTVQELASRLDMNRVTVHSAVEQLRKKGFFVETRKGKRRLILAEDPDVLYRLLQRRKNELNVMEMNLDQVVKLLNTVQVSDRAMPTVRCYEGIEGFKKMLEETLSAKNGVRVFTYVDLFQALLDPAYLENYFKRRSAKGIHTKLIFPPCAFADRVNKKAEAYKIQVRLLPKELKWKSGFFSWNDNVALMSYSEGRLTTTIIQNADIADFVRNIIFELIWVQAKSM